MSKLSMDDLFNSEVTHRAFSKDLLRKLKGWPHRELEGTEKEQMMTILLLKEGEEESNNQRSTTTTYEHNGKKYKLTDFGDGDIIIDEECEWEDIGL